MILPAGAGGRPHFPDHPYGRESKGTLETLPRITADDLRDYVRRVFARNELEDLDCR